MVFAQAAVQPPASTCVNAQAASLCLNQQVFDVAGASPKLLVVYLPDAFADAPAAMAVAADGSAAIALSQQLKATAIAIRPMAMPPNASPYVIRAEEVSAYADALRKIRSSYPGKKILLVGHASGAVMAALLASTTPASADAFLLAACPCDMPAWRRWRNSSTTAPTLSPADETGKVSPQVRLAVVVGNRDDNTLPKFSETYVSRLQARGVKTRLTTAANATHVSVQRAPEFFMLAQSLADELSR